MVGRVMLLRRCAMAAIRAAVLSSPCGKMTRASGVFTCCQCTEGRWPPNCWANEWPEQAASKAKRNNLCIITAGKNIFLRYCLFLHTKQGDKPFLYGSRSSHQTGRFGRYQYHWFPGAADMAAGLRADPFQRAAGLYAAAYL